MENSPVSGKSINQTTATLLKINISAGISQLSSTQNSKKKKKITKESDVGDSVLHNKQKEPPEVL